MNRKSNALTTTPRGYKRDRKWWHNLQKIGNNSFMVTNQRWQTRARSGAVAPRLYLEGRHFDMYSFEDAAHKYQNAAYFYRCCTFRGLRICVLGTSASPVKRLNRSRCRLDGRLVWAKETSCLFDSGCTFNHLFYYPSTAVKSARNFELFCSRRDRQTAVKAVSSLSPVTEAIQKQHTVADCS